MPYQVGSGFFLKTLLGKRYALPTQVINALIAFFCKFGDETKQDAIDEEDDDMDVDS